MISRADWAGSQKIVYTIIKGLMNSGSGNITLDLLTGSEGPLVKYLKSLGTTVHIIPTFIREIDPFKDLKTFLQIRQFLYSTPYDILHLHNTKATVIGVLAARTCNREIKLIQTVHGLWAISPENGIKGHLFNVIEKTFMFMNDSIVFVCKKDLEKAKKWHLGPSRYYHLIYNSIEPPEPCNGKLRKELNISDHTRIVGNVGRLDQPKNPFRFLEVARKVLIRRNDVVFVWIGESITSATMRKELSDMVRKDKILRERVLFMGYRKDAASLISDFDVFLFTSDSEGLPLVILEAMALKVPIVSTDVGGIREIADKNTRICRIGSPEKCSEDLACETLNTLSSVQMDERDAQIEPCERMVKEYLHLYRQLCPLAKYD